MSTDPAPRQRRELPTLAKLGIFALALALVLTAGYGVGRLFPTTTVPDADPSGPAPTPSSGGHGHGGGSSTPTTEASKESGGHDHGGSKSGHDEAAQGTVATAQGHTVTLLTPTLGPGRQQVRLLITGPDGRPVTAYDEVHEKELHLIAVRDDLAGFNHVHPTRSADGTWSATLDLSPGTWRIYADSQPATLDEQVVLAATLTVTGPAATTRLPAPALTAQVDGYTVTLPASAGELAEGERELTFTISRDGKPVTDLEPYLGAYAHVVLLRQRDLAYHHVHPQEGPAGPTVVAHAEFPSNGTYRAYVEFVHDGSLHRAEFTLEVS